jgi:prepilin-type processing-associated H-X9-DG protein
MEPEDLTLGGAIAGLASKSGLRISSSHGSRLANVVLADGSVAELPTNISPELLRTVLTEDFNQLYKYVSREQIEGMRSDAYPYFWLRLPAWIASIITPA